MSYHAGFLYMSDGYGNPTEVINEARTAANLRRASTTGAVSRFNLIADNANCPALAYQPCNDWSPDYVKNQVTALRDATLWMDPTFSTTGEVGLQNWGTGGEIMNASYPTPGTSPLLLQHTGSNYLYFPGVANNSVRCTTIGDYNIVADLEVVCRVSLDDWTGAAEQFLGGKYNTTGAQRSWTLSVATSGRPRLYTSADGAVAVAKDANATPAFQDGKPYWLKVTFDADDGAGNNVTNFYYAADQTDEPTSWTQIGTSVVVAGVASIFVSTADMEIGTYSHGTTGPMTGKMYRFVARNGIGGPTVFDCDFGRLSTGAETTIVERSRHNRTMTISRSTAGRKAVAVVRNTLLFGTDDYLEIPDNVSLDGAASSFTVMMAIRQWGTPVNFGRYIDKRDVNAPNVGWSLSTSGTTIQGRVDVDSGAGQVAAFSNLFTAGALTLLGFVIDRVANTVTAFTNGVAGPAQNLVTNAVGDISNGLPVRIGRIANSTGNQDFEMFTTSIWNRALSTTEISEMYTYYNTVPPANTLGGSTGWQLIDTNASGAPWYVTGNTASTEGYGFYIEEWTGLDGAHHSRAITPYGPGRGGATFGRQTSAHRTMAINVLLVGASNRGLNHLFRWLESTLLSSCACDNPSMWFREYCPDVSSLTDGLARADDVALVGPVQWESPPLEDAGCFVRRASFVLASGSPCLFREPVTLTTATSTLASWQTVPVPPNGPESLSASYRTISSGVWASTNTRAIGTVTPPAYGSTAPYILISSPAGADSTYVLPQLRIVGYLNPADMVSTDIDAMHPVGGLVLNGVPAGAEVIVDIASAKVLMRIPSKSLEWEPADNLIAIRLGSAGSIYESHISLRGPDAGWKRWFSFENCDEGIVVVEPNRYYQVGEGPFVSQWTVTIGQHDKFGCI